jgi:hypothetical protein
MGREQRSRKRLPPDAVCYLCGTTITPQQRWDRDHVPPARIFGASIKQEFNPQLQWLYTHHQCNGSYRLDEDYFVVSFVGHVVNSSTAKAVMEDLRRGVAKGHGVGLLKDVLRRFGTVLGPGGERTYDYDTVRVSRAIWKIVRGLYFLEVGAVLRADWSNQLTLMNPNNVPVEIANTPWFPAIRDTEPMGRYGRVFDYKWVGVIDGNRRGHALAMLFWDGLIVTARFHDPSCPCGECETARAGEAVHPQEQGGPSSDQPNDSIELDPE